MIGYRACAKLHCKSSLARCRVHRSKCLATARCRLAPGSTQLIGWPEHAPRAIQTAAKGVYLRAAALCAQLYYGLPDRSPMDFLKSAVASAISKGPPFPYTFGDRVEVDNSIWTLYNGVKRVCYCYGYGLMGLTTDLVDGLGRWLQM